MIFYKKYSANILYILFMFVMIFIVLDAFMPTLKGGIDNGVSEVEDTDQGALLSLLFYAVPILLVLMALYGIIYWVAVGA